MTTTARAKVASVVNQKGGVGKTTCAVNLTRAAVRRGARVLYVDADPQGSGTAVITAEDLSEDAPGLANALSNQDRDTSMADVIVPGLWPGLDVVPTVGGALGIVRDELVVAPLARERRLHDSLAPVLDRYDLVVIDTGPSLDQLTINALVASDVAVAISVADYLSSRGLVQLLDTITTVQQHYAPDLRFAGVIVNRYDARTKDAPAWLAQLREAADSQGFSVLDPIIHARAAIATATQEGTALDESRRGRQHAEEFAQLLDKITEGALK
ncbi:ParA family protein [Luteococcus sp.]|uniref:ParA family protein n=1 Tax=Luteococcus sp. TaxID=1969402 RepID=UPI003735D67B